MDLVPDTFVSSAGRPAAIDGNHAADHKTGGRAAEQNRCPLDLFQFPPPFLRHRTNDEFLRLITVCYGNIHRGQKGAGTDRVARNAVSCQFE